MSSAKASTAAAARYGLWWWRAAVASELAAVGSGGVRQRRRRRCATALLRDERRHVEVKGGDEKICQSYVRTQICRMWGGVLQIGVFMTNIHTIGLKIGLKRHKFVSLRPIFLCLCVFRNAPLSAELFLCTTHVQTTTNILIDACENTMNNGGRRHTTTAIVPHPRLGGVEALAKKAMLQQGYDVKTTTSYD